MGADLAGQFQRLGFDVDGDHLGRGRRPGDLHTDVTEAAHADQTIVASGVSLGHERRIA